MRQRSSGRDRYRFVCAVIALVLGVIGVIPSAIIGEWGIVAISTGLALFSAYLLYIRHTDFDRWLSWDRRSRKRQRRTG